MNDQSSYVGPISGYIKKGLIMVRTFFQVS